MCAGSSVGEECDVLCLDNYEWPRDQAVVCVAGGSWSIESECVAVGDEMLVGTAGILYLIFTASSDFTLEWAQASVLYFVEAAASLLGVDSGYVRVEFSSLGRRVRTRFLQESDLKVRVTKFGTEEEDASEIEFQMVCAFFDCVNGSDSVGLNDISDVFMNAIVLELEADGQAVPSGLSTAQPRFSDFSSVDNFTYAVPESSERSSVSSGSEEDNSAAIGIVIGASLGGCCIVCVVMIVAVVLKRGSSKAST